MRRKNNPRKGGKSPTISYTLQWIIYGQKSVLSLGRGATLAYAKRIAAEKERELNAESPSDVLQPITWDKFRAKYFDTSIQATIYRRRNENQCSWPSPIGVIRSPPRKEKSS